MKELLSQICHSVKQSNPCKFNSQIGNISPVWCPPFYNDLSGIASQ